MQELHAKLDAIQQDAVLKLAGVTQYTVLTGNDASADIRAGTDLGAVTDDGGSLNGHVVGNLHVLTHPHTGFELGEIGQASLDEGEDVALDLGEHLPRVLARVEQIFEVGDLAIVKVGGFNQLIQHNDPFP